MAKYYDKNRPEEETGEQLFHTRVKRGRNRKPSWKEVERWRERWTPDLVRTVIKTLK